LPIIHKEKIRKMKERTKNTVLMVIIVVLSLVIPLLSSCGIKGDLVPADKDQREPKREKVFK